MSFFIREKLVQEAMTVNLLWFWGQHFIKDGVLLDYICDFCDVFWAGWNKTGNASKELSSLENKEVEKRLNTVKLWETWDRVKEVDPAYEDYAKSHFMANLKALEELEPEHSLAVYIRGKL